MLGYMMRKRTSDQAAKVARRRGQRSRGRQRNHNYILYGRESCLRKTTLSCQLITDTRGLWNGRSRSPTPATDPASDYGDDGDQVMMNHIPPCPTT